VHLVGFAIEIYHDTRSHEHQTLQYFSKTCEENLTRITGT